MPVVIYGIHLSPPVRAVLLTAKAIGLDIDFKICNIMQGDNKKEGYLKMNPAHSIPTMDDNGFYLPESRAIMTYLTQKYAKDDQLYPKDLKKRAVVDSMLYFDASSLFPSLAAYYTPRLLRTPKIPGTEDTVKEKLNILNTILEQRKYAAGDHLTLADFSLAATLSLPEAAKFDLSPYSNITQWFSKIKALSYYAEASNKGIEELTAVYDARPEI